MRCGIELCSRVFLEDNVRTPVVIWVVVASKDGRNRINGFQLNPFEKALGISSGLRRVDEDRRGGTDNERSQAVETCQ